MWLCPICHEPPKITPHPNTTPYLYHPRPPESARLQGALTFFFGPCLGKTDICWKNPGQEPKCCKKSSVGDNICIARPIITDVFRSRSWFLLGGERFYAMQGIISAAPAFSASSCDLGASIFRLRGSLLELECICLLTDATYVTNRIDQTDTTDLIQYIQTPYLPKLLQHMQMTRRS